MTQHYTATIRWLGNLTILMLLATSMAAPASAAPLMTSESAPISDVHEPVANASWLSVATPGIGYRGLAGKVSLEVLLGSGASGRADIDAPDSTLDTSMLTSLVAQVPFTGALENETLTLTYLAQGRAGLTIQGMPYTENGTSGLRVSLVDYPAGSPFVPTNDVITIIEAGWHDDVITIGFAYDTTEARNATVVLDAEGEGRHIHMEAPAELGTGGAYFAKFKLEHLPAVLTWEAIISSNGQEDGRTSAHVSFPTYEATDADPLRRAPGSHLVAAGGFHDVTGTKQQIPIAKTVLAPVFTGTKDCPSRAPYDTMGGETFRISHLASRGGNCPEETPPIATPPPPVPTTPPTLTPTENGAPKAPSAWASLFHWSPWALVQILSIIVLCLLIALLIARNRRVHH